MGLSASQARLLSITARLSDNELHSQQIANSKVRLADKTQEASREYIDALSATKLMYTTYDAKGNATQCALTPAIMYEYSDLKNQYGLSNTSGQLLVSATDAQNYEKSTNINDFVQCYGIDLIQNPKYIKELQSIYGVNYNDFHNQDNVYHMANLISELTTDDISNIRTIISKDATELNNSDAANVNAIINGWSNSLKDNLGIAQIGALTGSFGEYANELFNLTKQFPKKADFEEQISQGGGASLSAKFAEASRTCYNSAMNDNSAECYLHVLAHLLDLNVADVDANGEVSPSYERNYNTTVGNKYVVEINSSKINGSWINMRQKTADMAEVSEYICNPDNNIMAPSDPNDTANFKSSDLEKLLSNYKYIYLAKEPKTFKEKIIDLYYVVEHRADFKDENGSELITYEELKPYLQAFQEDLKGSLMTIFNEEKYIADIESWKVSVETWLDRIEEARKVYIEDLSKLSTPMIPNDNDPKIDWYVNLWHRMNGESDYKSAAGQTGAYHKQLDDNLLNNQDWLKFALEHGVVTLEKVIFVDEAENVTGLKNSKWQATMHNTCTDISEVDDEIAIAKAEADYKRKLNEIEAKDKKYDNDIKKLDTEHTALQTEYDSVKSVIDKNVERSFKAFS